MGSSYANMDSSSLGTSLPFGQARSPVTIGKQNLDTLRQTQNHSFSAVAGLNFSSIQQVPFSSSFSLGWVQGAGADATSMVTVDRGLAVLTSPLCWVCVYSLAFPEMNRVPCDSWLDRSHPTLLMQLCQLPHPALALTAMS